jgi:hypothetical protein
MWKCFVTTFAGIAFLSITGSAAEYYVSSNGTDTSAGTAVQPWRTIQKAANTLRAGDTVYVGPGVYNERVTTSTSGNAGSLITFVGGTNVVCRGFTLSNCRYLRIIGFEIAHVNTSYTRAVTLSGTTSNIEILNNYIHNINVSGGAVGNYAGTHKYITVRGNAFYYLAYIPGVTTVGNGWAVESGYQAGNWLVEYNTAQRCGDFINMHGTNQIVRNNWLFDYDDSYFSSGGGHVDIFQPGSAGVMTWTRNHLYESNIAGDNVEDNSHFFQIRDTSSGGFDGNILCRGNVGYNFGSYILQAGGLDHVVHYNNTFHSLGNGTYQREGMMWYNAEGGNPSLLNENFNNVFSAVKTGEGNVLITAQGGSTVNASNNLGFETPAHPSLVSTSDPLYVDVANKQFYVRSGSPAINAGKPISTVTSPAGNGTTFNVADGLLFCDGWGIAEGDVIKVGASAPARIVRVDGNNITTDRAVSWSTGTGVFWRNQDDRPDIGAYEAGDYSYEIALTAPVNGASVSGQTQLQATVTNPGVVRSVIFYVNGVPVGQDFDSPYSITWNAPATGPFTVEARAYALHARTDATRVATITLQAGSPGAEPTPPENLRIVSQ